MSEQVREMLTPLLPLMRHLVGPRSHYKDKTRNARNDPAPLPDDTIGMCRLRGLTWRQAETIHDFLTKQETTNDQP